MRPRPRPRPTTLLLALGSVGISVLAGASEHLGGGVLLSARVEPDRLVIDLATDATMAGAQVLVTYDDPLLGTTVARLLLLDIGVNASVGFDLRGLRGTEPLRVCVLGRAVEVPRVSDVSDLPLGSAVSDLTCEAEAHVPALRSAIGSNASLQSSTVAYPVVSLYGRLDQGRIRSVQGDTVRVLATSSGAVVVAWSEYETEDRDVEVGERIPPQDWKVKLRISRDGGRHFGPVVEVAAPVTDRPVALELAEESPRKIAVALRVLEPDSERRPVLLVAHVDLLDEAVLGTSTYAAIRSAFIPSVAALPTGELLVAALENNASGSVVGGLWLWRLDPESGLASSIHFPDRVVPAARVLAGSDGLVGLVWEEGAQRQPARLWFAVSRDNGVHFGEPSIVGELADLTGSCEGDILSLSGNGGDKAHLVWRLHPPDMSALVECRGNFHVAIDLANGVSTIHRVEGPDGISRGHPFSGWNPVVTAAGSRAWVAWETQPSPGGPLLYWAAESLDDGRTFGRPYAVSVDVGPEGHFGFFGTRSALLPDGRPVMLGEGNLPYENHVVTIPFFDPLANASSPLTVLHPVEDTDPSPPDDGPAEPEVYIVVGVEAPAMYDGEILVFTVVNPTTAPVLDARLAVEGLPAGVSVRFADDPRFSLGPGESARFEATLVASSSTDEAGPTVTGLVEIEFADGTTSEPLRFTTSNARASAVSGASAPAVEVLLPVLGAGALVGVGAAALVEPLRVGFLTALAPLYSRLRRSDVLDHPVRSGVFRHVQANPGIRYERMRRDLGLPSGALAFHLRALERGGYVTARTQWTRRVYFATGKVPPPGGDGLAGERIGALLRERPRSSQSDLARALGISRQLARYHLKKLEREGAVVAERVGRELRYRLRDERPPRPNR